MSDSEKRFYTSFLYGTVNFLHNWHFFPDIDPHNLSISYSEYISSETIYMELIDFTVHLERSLWTVSCIHD